MNRWCLLLSVLTLACGAPSPDADASAGHDAASPPNDAAVPADAGTEADASGLDAGDPDPDGPALGTATVLEAPCPRARLLGEGQSCTYVEIDCAHVGTSPTMRAELRVTAPTAPERGTIWLGSGSQGGGFYGSGTLSGPLVRELAAEGFRVVERAWEVTRETQGGWFTGTEGVRVAACRSATLMEHVQRTLTADSRPFCASANSGGAMELAFAASVWRADRFLDLAMPTSGPAHRVDLACAGAGDPTWVLECEAIRARYPVAASVACELDGPRRTIDQAYGGRTVCTMPSATDLAVLRADSPTGEGAATLLSTPFRFLYGGADPMGAVTLGIAYAEALRDAGSDATVEVVPSGIHDLADDPLGSRRIFEILRDECVPR